MKIKGFKGFNSKLQCTPKDKVFQYEVGKTYEEDEVELCQCGFHFCEDPLDIFKYYLPLYDARYCEIEADNVSDETGDDSKRVCKRLSVKKEIGLQDLIQAGINFRLNKVNESEVEESNIEHGDAISVIENHSIVSSTRDYGVASSTGLLSIAATTGEYGAASDTGGRSVASSTGWRSVASSTGWNGVALAAGLYGVALAAGDWSVALAAKYRSIALSTGDHSIASSTGECGAASVDKSDSIASALGADSKAKGAIGSWIVLSEWVLEEKWILKDVQCRLVDGEQIKADTWYALKDGEFVEVDE